MLEAHRTPAAEHDFELAYPIYRVHFWVPGPRAWEQEAWYLTGVDSVLEALAWVHRHALGRRFELFAEAREHRGDGGRTAPLVRLAGVDPNASSPVTGSVRVVKA